MFKNTNNLVEEILKKLPLYAAKMDLSKSKPIRGLYIDNDSAKYVIGVVEHFKQLIHISSEIEIENELIINFNKHSYNSKNRFILEYFGLVVRGPVIITNKDKKSDVESNLHQYICNDKTIHPIKNCDNCNEIILYTHSTSESYHEVEYYFNCKSIFVNCKNLNKHNHLFCNYCYSYLISINDNC